MAIRFRLLAHRGLVSLEHFLQLVLGDGLELALVDFQEVVEDFGHLAPGGASVSAGVRHAKARRGAARRATTGARGPYDQAHLLEHNGSLRRRRLHKRKLLKASTELRQGRHLVQDDI